MTEVIYINIPEPAYTPPKPKETEDPNLLCRKFSEWLENSLPGDKLCYYFGDYVAGRSVGRLAFNAYENGSVLLYQKKEGAKRGYWAVRTKRFE